MLLCLPAFASSGLEPGPDRAFARFVFLTCFAVGCLGIFVSFSFPEIIQFWLHCDFVTLLPPAQQQLSPPKMNLGGSSQKQCHPQRATATAPLEVLMGL